MTRRSLSKREADIVLALEWDKQRLITIKDIVKRLRCTRNYAYWLAHNLEAKGWLEAIVPGTFLLIGAERGPKGVPEMNPYVIARVLPKPYFFAYRWACLHHGLTAQVPTLVHVALARPKRPIEIKNARFEFINLTPKRMFGFMETEKSGEKLNVSDLERTVLDAIDRPELVGGIEAAAEAVFQAGKQIEFAKLLDYLRRFDDSALARRLGYLCELLKVPLPKNLSGYLSAQTKRLPAYLGAPGRWGKEGPLDKSWRLVINVPREELLGEIHIG
ncbi:MAG: hypothetical protein AUJ52_06620 [Elusimicrobia bacterium CG1_02_63_36]|nr:MAG: hypothetical protein AUJ52_06620 [Elusimicrobia bacterium CG1_02_63_36]PIP82518.1 MAG: hypothetical protein COR54_14480 [Elusimicrobia bacterium CG22_combo_CG10-13_8_21_14_all_63_91]PJA16512.1 MAG: hypothetical protein COX66_07285 [Elusimicrobia bacterium CG_4_10_14_0_2_um_filter_63_34]PJB25141.1 MAG: hypothetical protein CO113_10235 [Elusimicrobia bacterium CG_4_9_14_3_um_filter_62_55]